MVKNYFDIKGKVAVMTGACGILGTTIVKYFAAQGAKVVLLDLERASELGAKIVSEIKADGGEACFLATNVLDKSVLEDNYARIMEMYGRIDILLNAAGGNMASATVPPDKSIFDLDVDAVKKVTELNLFGTIIPKSCRLRCRQGGGGQLDQVAVRRAGYEIRGRLEGQRDCSGFPSDQPEQDTAYQS